MKLGKQTGKKRKKDDYEDLPGESKKWFDEIPVSKKHVAAATEQMIIELKEEAKVCNDSETANFNIKNTKNNSDFQWMKTVMSKGTVSDRIAAHTVAIQDDPVHNIKLLRDFIGMAKISKKNECIGVIDTLTDLFLENLLPPNRKLESFDRKPLTLLTELSSGNAVSRRKILSIWYFEDQLKNIFNIFVDALNTAAQDSVETTKEKAIAAMYKLLAGNPEQEKKLLSLIVNKLGDPSQKVASKTIYCLEQLLRKHSNMQSVVLNEVEKLLFRTNVSTKAQYYGLCFLSQFYLNHEETDVAKRLIDVYFGFFKACVKKGEIDTRMMSALLMGVNRAYPYANLDSNKIAEHVDTIYRIVHIANFNISLHALNLLYQVSDCGNNITDRFYSALYKKLLDPQIATTTHQAMLLSLIYKSMLKDTEINRVKAIVKRLLQLCVYLTPSFASGIMYLISQLLGKRSEIHSIVQKQTSFGDIDDDDDEEKYKDSQIDLDVSVKEEVLSDEEKEVLPADSVHLTTNTAIPIEEDEKPDVKPELDVDNKSTGWYHRNINVKKEKGIGSMEYNPFNRNPLYAGAEHSAFIELNDLRNHYHPTVSLYATNILNGETIKYQGDPLKDFTLIRFLDRFVFKNPKKADELKKGSHPTFGQRKLYQPKGVKAISVTSSNYMNTEEANIPVDEKFLYMYLNKKYANQAMKKEDEQSDVDSVASDEFEEMLERMGGPPKDLDDDMDFMNDIGDNLQKEKSKKKGEGSDDEASAESSGELSEDDEFSDENEDMEGEDEMDEEDEELIKDVSSDDEEDLVFDESDDESSKKTKKSKKKGMDSLFASADEFASLLEDEGGSKRKPGGSNALFNKDQADAKQLNWEEKRNRWLSGYDKAVGKKKTSSNFKSKKRPNSNKSGNKKKKFKK